MTDALLILGAFGTLMLAVWAIDAWEQRKKQRKIRFIQRVLE
jgi:hypothetical protein